MNFIPDNIYHIYNQGNNKQQIFSSDEDYLIFLKIIKKCISPHAEIIAYCLMPNHFHFLIYADDRVNTMIKQGGLLIDLLTNGVRKLLSGYARIYNNLHNQAGSLFRQKTKYNCLSEITIPSNSINTHQDYYFNCFHYIHQNPLRAGLVKRLEDWEYSSFKDYPLLRNGTICNKELASKFCSYDPENFIKTSYGIISDNIINEFF
jgi:putative transposase